MIGALMRFLRGRFQPTLIILAALGSACEPDPVVEVQVEGYAGVPYPDQLEDIAYPSSTVVVTDSYSDTVTLLDAATGELVAQRPVGRNPVDIDGPHHLARDDAGGFFYIGLSYPSTGLGGPHASHGSSAVYGYVQKLRMSDLSVVGQVRVDPNPGDIILSSGGRVVTSHFDLLRAVENATDYEAAKATIAVVDPSELALTGSKPATLIKTCVAPHGMVSSPLASDLLYVACYGEDRLALVDLAPAEPTVELIDVGGGVSGFGSPTYGPYALTLSPTEPLLAVSNTASSDVRFFDTSARSFDPEQTIATLGAPFFTAFSEDGSTIFIPTQQPDELWVVDLTGSTEPLVRTFQDDECKLPHAVTLDGEHALVVCEGDRETPGQVVRLDASLNVVWRAEVGIYPDSISLVQGAPR